MFLAAISSRAWSRLLVLSVASTLAVAAAAPSQSMAQAMTPTKVAVVNPAKVFQEIQETKDLKSAMENKRKTLQSQEFEKQQKIKDLGAARDALKPDAPQYADRNRELQQAQVEFQVWGQVMQADVQRDQKMQMKSLFDKITAATAEVATAKGLDLVLTESRPEYPDNLDQLTVDQLRGLINSRNVLFNSPTIDISNDVIAAMDARYKSAK